MVLGNQVSSTVATVSKNIRMKDTIKILGVYFRYNDSQRKKLNFDEILRSIKEKLQMWKWRELTILGRIQIVKTFVRVTTTITRFAQFDRLKHGKSSECLKLSQQIVLFFDAGNSCAVGFKIHDSKFPKKKNVILQDP